VAAQWGVEEMTFLGSITSNAACSSCLDECIEKQTCHTPNWSFSASFWECSWLMRRVRFASGLSE
jgi:hypothetical protein